MTSIYCILNFNIRNLIYRKEYGMKFEFMSAFKNVKNVTYFRLINQNVL